MTTGIHSGETEAKTMNSLHDDEVNRYLVELVLADPQQFMVALLQVCQQRMGEILMQRLTEKLHACMNDVEREVLKVFDDMDDISDIDHEGGPQ